MGVRSAPLCPRADQKDTNVFRYDLKEPAAI